MSLLWIYFEKLINISLQKVGEYRSNDQIIVGDLVGIL